MNFFHDKVLAAINLFDSLSFFKNQVAELSHLSARARASAPNEPTLVMAGDLHFLMEVSEKCFLMVLYETCFFLDVLEGCFFF